jgi:hypothetical protein
MNPKYPPDSNQSPAFSEPHLRPGERAELERQIAGRTGWVYTVDVNSPEGVELAKQQEQLYMLWADRRERDAEVRKSEHEAAWAGHRAEDEPNRLRLRRRIEAAFAAVLLLVALAGAALIVAGVTANPLLLPAGGTTLSGALFGLRKQAAWLGSVAEPSPERGFSR